MSERTAGPKQCQRANTNGKAHVFAVSRDGGVDAVTCQRCQAWMRAHPAAAVRVLARAMGATVEREEDARVPTWQVVAPDGWRWIEGPHALVVVVAIPSDWLDALGRMTLERCPADCDCEEGA